MTDEELAALGTWVRAFHGVEIDPEKLKDLGRTAGRLARTVREAAAELPFEAEPATFFRALDDLAKEGSQ